MFPALNITDIARINLAGRTREEIEAEAVAILDVLRATRLRLSCARPSKATVCNMYRTMLTIDFYDQPNGDNYYTLSWTSDGLQMLQK